jgi:flavorubredoxin
MEDEMTITISENVRWVGKIDWELRKFHGDEYSTNRGSTYNSYLIQNRKTALIDTVWNPFSNDFLENLFVERAGEGFIFYSSTLNSMASTYVPEGL